MLPSLPLTWSLVGDSWLLETTDNEMEDVILRWQRGRRDHVAMTLFDWLAGQHSAAVCHRPLLHVHVLLLLVLLRRRRCPFSSHSSWPRSAAASLSAAASAAFSCRARAARKARQQWRRQGRRR